MTPVIWYKGLRGNWDHGLLLSIFDKHGATFPQYNELEDAPIGLRKNAIVIVAGRPAVEPLREYLSTFKRCLVILVSEEDAFFDWKAAIPPEHEVWTAYYHPSTKSEIKTRILLGAPTRIKDYKINKHLPKKFTWSFVGQIQNKNRQQMFEAVKKLPFGFLKIVEFFGGNGYNGTDYQTYLDIMCQSRFVLCPSGSMSVDSFRVYEAIECGAIPIVDNRTQRDTEDFNYWEAVCPGHRLLATDIWEDISIEGIQRLFPFDALNGCFQWWDKYKLDLEQKLLDYAAGLQKTA